MTYVSRQVLYLSLTYEQVIFHMLGVAETQMSYAPDLEALSAVDLTANRKELSGG